MELNHHYTGRIFHTHDGICQSLCRKGLAHARSSLKNDILFLRHQSNQRVVFWFFHVDFFQKHILIIRLKINLHRFYRIILEQCIQLRHVVCVRCNIRQGLHHSLSGVLPLALIGPVNIPDVPILGAGRIEFIIGLHDTATDNLMHPFPGKYDVARLHFVDKLPGGVRIVLVGFRRIDFIFHRLLHLAFAVKCRQITDFIPADAHYPGIIELIPAGCPISRRVQPVVDVINVIIVRALPRFEAQLLEVF